MSSPPIRPDRDLSISVKEGNGPLGLGGHVVLGIISVIISLLVIAAIAAPNIGLILIQVLLSC